MHMQVNFSWKVHIGPSLTIILCFKIPLKEQRKKYLSSFYTCALYVQLAVFKNDLVHYWLLKYMKNNK